MTDKSEHQIQRLKQALAELRSNRHYFSDESFAQITMLLLQELRIAQTATLPGDPEADEIRLVTVMFVDVKDSTEMVQKLDTSDWKTIIAQAHERIASLVNQWGGQVGQYLGDGVMCFFGAQHSQDSDAVNAVSCGLAIQQAITQYAVSVEERYSDIHFSMRIGISTGQLVVGLLGGDDQKREFLALGPATNRAARLQGIAEPGEVFIDEATYARVRHHFAVQPQEPALLKGFERAIQVYKVVGRRMRPAKHFTNTDVQGIYLPLLGRDEPLGLIDYLAEQAIQTGRGQVITLLGDIGVGKSRLLQAASLRLDQQFRTYTFKTSYEARFQQYNIIVDSARSYGYIHTGDRSKRERRRQKFLAQARIVLDDPVTEAAAQAIFDLSDGRIGEDAEPQTAVMIEWLTKVAEQQPILVLIDNLQWADDASVQFLEALAEALRDKPALIMASARLDFLTAHPTFLQDSAQHTRILLDPLPEETPRLLVNSVLQHVEGVPTALVDLIVERSEGNPLFIHEYLMMLFDMSIIEHGADSGWRLNFERYNDALNTLPHGLIALLQARLDELAPEARQVLQVAAVMGVVFWEDAVDTMTRLKDVRHWLESLTTQGIIVHDSESMLQGETQYRFRYQLYRNVAYEMIPRGQRMRYHQFVAEWLLLHTNGQPQGYPLLATHFARGEQYAAALYTYQEAVQDRLQREDAQGALDLIDTGLGLASHLPRSEALPIVSKLWLYRAQSLCLLQRYDEASAASQSALMLTRELPAQQFMEVRAAAEITLADAFIATGRTSDAAEALQRAQQLLPEEDTALQAAFRIQSGKLSEAQGRMRDAEADYERAKRSAEKAAHLSHLRIARSNLANLLLERGRIAEALVILQEQSQNQNVAGEPQVTASLSARIGLARVYLALELPLQALVLLENVPEPETLPTAANAQIQLLQALASLRSEDPLHQKEGKQGLQKLLEGRYERTDLQQEIALAQAESLLQQGSYEEVRLLLTNQVADAGLGFPVLQARRLRLLGEALYRLDNPVARATLQDALEGESTYGGRDSWHCHLWLARTAEDEAARVQHQQQAAKQVQALAESLSANPALQSAFLAAPRVRAALEPLPQRG
jgi:class 3 adenylate cyclase/predicted ATPase